ncbi:MAG: FlgD immunoglobulin-like domain containing protein [Actinomycetota bacterium]
MSRDGRLVRLLAFVCFLLASLAAPLLAQAADPATISGVAFQDLNRDGARQEGEPAMADHLIYIFDTGGEFVTSAITDGLGRYEFAGLSDGEYRVQYASSSWWHLRRDWVPTSTGSLHPSVSVQLVGSAQADFGWRPITRSTDLAAPLSSFVAPSGLEVFSYDDVVSAPAVHDALLSGSLIGPEAAATTIYFDFGPTSSCVTSVAGSPGSYNGFEADVWIDYLSWLDSHDVVLFHEYGHDWSLYNAYIVQQDESLSSYLEARGLRSDPRIGTSKAWDPKEMIAEDYRQLFGSASAAAYPQANTEIPRAADVPGLRDFLQHTFTGPAPPPEPPAPSTPPTPPALAVTDLSVAPDPVVKSGTISFMLSVSAAVRVEIRDAAGALVRTLLQEASRPAGTVAVAWDRRNAMGRRVRAGTYLAVVLATTAREARSAARTFGVT